MLPKLPVETMPVSASWASQEPPTPKVMYPERVDTQAAGQPWAGLGPTTPTAIRIIQRSHTLGNGYFNVGHGALGWTLAAGSAVVLGRLVDRTRA